MLIDITSMTGEMPRVPPHLLDGNIATLAQDCEFRRGVIDPAKNDVAQAKNFAFSPKTIWRYRDDFWFAFQNHTDLIRSPVAQDIYGRVYWTEDGYPPRYTLASEATKGSGNYPTTFYKLGIFPPTTTITVKVNNPPHYKKSDKPVVAPKAPQKIRTLKQIYKDAPILLPFVGSNNATPDAIDALPDGYFDIMWRVETLTGTHDYQHYEEALSYWQQKYDLIKATPDMELDEPDPINIRSVFYTQTYVSDLGEESAPGLPSDEVTLLWSDSSAKLTLQPPAAQASRITHRRIYRTASGGGVAGYLLVVELPIAQTEYLDDRPDAALSAALETERYLPPPEDLKGLCLMANGIAAGFTGNTVHFSQAYLPYAWNPGNRLTTSADIVAIAPIGTSLVVTTKEEPWLFSGASPAAITGIRLPILAPCISRTSMVSMGDIVVYAAPRGLVGVNARGEAQMITEPLLTEQQWQALDPQHMRAWQWRGEYYATLKDSVIIFSPQSGSIRRLEGLPGSVYADTERDCYWYTVGTRLIKSQCGGDKPWHWKSKLWLMPDNTTFSCLRIRSTRPAAIGIKIFCDGRMIVHYPRGSLGENIQRLPAATGRQWQIEAYGNVPLERITIASTNAEMAP